MNWNEYLRFLDQKISDSRHNLEFAEKALKKAKAKYEAALREKESFEISLNDLVGE